MMSFHNSFLLHWRQLFLGKGGEPSIFTYTFTATFLQSTRPLPSLRLGRFLEVGNARRGRHALLDPDSNDAGEISSGNPIFSVAA